MSDSQCSFILLIMDGICIIMQQPGALNTANYIFKQLFFKTANVSCKIQKTKTQLLIRNFWQVSIQNFCYTCFSALVSVTHKDFSGLMFQFSWISINITITIPFKWQHVITSFHRLLITSALTLNNSASSVLTVVYSTVSESLIVGIYLVKVHFCL